MVFYENKLTFQILIKYSPYFTAIESKSQAFEKSYIYFCNIFYYIYYKCIIIYTTSYPESTRRSL